MKAVAVLRISSDTQADGQGLDVQRQQVTDWCHLHGHELVAIHEDITSGTNGLADRDGLAAALAAISAGQAQLLVVPRLDRLARDLVLSEQLLREVWNAGGEVASCAEGEANLRDDPEDPSRALIRQVLGAVAAYERAMIGLRMKRGRMAKAARGGFATGSPPFGWRTDGHGELEEDPDEQATIELIVGLRREGRSLRAVADQLNEWRKPPKRGAAFRWHPGGVARVLDRAQTPTEQ